MLRFGGLQMGQLIQLGYDRPLLFGRQVYINLYLLGKNARTALIVTVVNLGLRNVVLSVFFICLDNVLATKYFASEFTQFL